MTKKAERKMKAVMAWVIVDRETRTIVSIYHPNCAKKWVDQYCPPDDRQWRIARVKITEVTK